MLQEELALPGEEEVLVRTRYSALSPGTERLIYEGDVPEGMAADPSIEALHENDLSFPLSYGYACVGEVEALGERVSEEWEGARVFAFQPHVSRFVTDPSTLIRLPETVELTDAVLIPTVETAVNLVMDGRPMIGERVVVFGQGIVGLMTTQLLVEYPLEGVSTIESNLDRRRHSKALGATESRATISELEGMAGSTSSSDSAVTGADLVYELTGSPQVLNDAIQVTGYSGRIVVGSWYGKKRAPIDLGGRFHRSRMKIISSQVSTISPSYRGRWTKSRRMSTVLMLLNDLTPSRLISDQFRVEEAPQVYDRLSNDTSMLQPVFVYE